MKIVLLLPLLLLSCAGTSTTPSGPIPESTSRVQRAAFTREDALLRKSQVKNVTYQLWFLLDRESTEFQGRAVLQFDWDSHSPLRVDFAKSTIDRVKLQGKEIPSSEWTPWVADTHLLIPAKRLTKGAQKIEIAFHRPYSTSGDGLYRFIDPQDGEVYLYTNLEPYSAHEVFPCFDQPDLKASVELTVEAPKDWVVIGNTKEQAITGVDGRSSWQFRPSPLQSTYLFALIAGPYHAWKSEAQGIPLRLFARKTLKAYVDAPGWFEITKRGLEFFGNYFQVPYPYSKYDQILVPDFNPGAMENIGAVTFNEKFLYRSKPTSAQLTSRAEVILHEMAHMWFGNLVTMRWWNGLWLNESFATFMASLASSESLQGLGLLSSWENFFQHMKEWAYWQDHLPTTHPIEVSVPDTDHAMTQFDGITYGKGASVLKQLRFWLGDDAFREGLHRYFLKFSQKNTTLADLLSALAESSGKNLTIWQKEWLQEPGTNTLKAEFSCEDEKIQSFTLLQGNRKHSKTLRTHRTRVALYRRTKSGDLSLSDALDVTYSGERTVVTGLHGKPCPAFVFPNHEDHDFVLVELDETSLESFSKDPKQPQDPLTRDMVWHSLSESTRDGKFSPMRLGKLALQALKTERDAPRAKLLLALLFSPELAGGSVSHFLTSSKQEEVLTELQSFLRERLKLKSTPRDLQMEYWNRFLSLSVRFTDSDRKWLRGLLSGTAAPPKGVDLGEDRRWEILGALAQADDPEVLTLIDLQSKRDPSQAGVIEYHAARASQRGNRSIRQEYLEAILDPAKLSARNLKTQVMKSTIRRFYQFEDPSSESERIDTYRKLLNGFSNSATPLGALIRSDEGYGRTLLRGLYPVACGGASLAELRTLLESSRTKIPVYAERTLRELFTTSEECEAIRN